MYLETRSILHINSQNLKMRAFMVGRAKQKPLELLHTKETYQKQHCITREISEVYAIIQALKERSRNGNTYHIPI